MTLGNIPFFRFKILIFGTKSEFETHVPVRICTNTLLPLAASNSSTKTFTVDVLEEMISTKQVTPTSHIPARRKNYVRDDIMYGITYVRDNIMYGIR